MWLGGEQGGFRDQVGSFERTVRGGELDAGLVVRAGCSGDFDLGVISAVVFVDDLDFVQLGWQEDGDGLEILGFGEGQDDGGEGFVLLAIKAAGQSDLPAGTALHVEACGGLLLVDFPALAIEFLDGEAADRVTALGDGGGEGDPHRQDLGLLLLEALLVEPLSLLYFQALRVGELLLPFFLISEALCLGIFGDLLGVLGDEIPVLLFLSEFCVLRVFGQFLPQAFHFLGVRVVLAALKDDVSADGGGEDEDDGGEDDGFAFAAGRGGGWHGTGAGRLHGHKTALFLGLLTFGILLPAAGFLVVGAIGCGLARLFVGDSSGLGLLAGGFLGLLAFGFGGHFFGFFASLLFGGQFGRGELAFEIGDFFDDGLRVIERDGLGRGGRRGGIELAGFEISGAGRSNQRGQFGDRLNFECGEPLNKPAG